MYLSPFEMCAAIKAREQALRREAEQDRLLAAGPARSGWLEHLLAATGRLLVAIGTKLEARYGQAVTSVPMPAVRPNGSG